MVPGSPAQWIVEGYKGLKGLDRVPTCRGIALAKVMERHDSRWRVPFSLSQPSTLPEQGSSVVDE